MSIAKIQLPASIVNQLVAMPETGMGYQLVKVVLKSGQIFRKLKVLNSSVLIVDTNQPINDWEIERVELDN